MISSMTTRTRGVNGRNPLGALVEWTSAGLHHGDRDLVTRYHAIAENVQYKFPIKGRQCLLFHGSFQSLLCKGYQDAVLKPSLC